MNVIVIVVIVLVFSFIMGIIVVGNDNHKSEEDLAKVVDDPSVLFENNNQVVSSTESISLNDNLGNPQPLPVDNSSNVAQQPNVLDNTFVKPQVLPNNDAMVSPVVEESVPVVNNPVEATPTVSVDVQPPVIGGGVLGNTNVPKIDMDDEII